MGIENVSLGQSFNTFATRTGAAGDSAANEKFTVATNTENYKPNFINLGKSYTEYLDKTFGNNDGKLTLDEFKKRGFFRKILESVYRILAPLM